MSTIHGLLLTY